MRLLNNLKFLYEYFLRHSIPACSTATGSHRLTEFTDNSDKFKRQLSLYCLMLIQCWHDKYNIHFQSHHKALNQKLKLKNNTDSVSNAGVLYIENRISYIHSYYEELCVDVRDHGVLE